MKPIAQTFIVNESPSGVEAVFLTKIDLYFRSKSSVFGVELQIRETSNGSPTSRVLPYASKSLTSSQINTSHNGSLSTTFEFETPVLIKTNEQYAFVVVPEGGNPDTTVWIAELGGIDVSHESTPPIIKNNELGSLFVSSNDLNFTPIQNESIKYTAYIANFTSSTATANFKNSPTDHVIINNPIGTFRIGERVVVSNNYIKNSALTISGGNTFQVGERVFQPGGTSPANISVATAYGTVYFANTTKVLMKDTYGAFLTSGTIRGETTNYTAGSPSFANQSIVTNSNSTITVPDANNVHVNFTDFGVGNYLYVGKNTGANTQLLQIASVNATERTITFTSDVNFTDSSAIIGRIKGDGDLQGTLLSSSGDLSNQVLLLGAVTANSLLNFSGSNGNLVIGRTSGSIATVSHIQNLEYENITTMLPDIEPEKTNISWSFKGTVNDVSRTRDSVAKTVSNEVPYEFVDNTRIILSRSNEYANPTTDGVGNSSLTLAATLESQNSKISPYIDLIRPTVTTIHNINRSESATSGVVISYNNANGNLTIGNIIRQVTATGNVQGTVTSTNSSVAYVSGLTYSNTSSVETFSITTPSVIDVTRSITVNVSSLAVFNETGNIPSGAPSYISKNIILGDQQDAEDLRSYITAYRPPGANFKVYGKFLSGADSDKFTDKDWSALVELTASSLRSSAVNSDDFVELIHNLPTSVQKINQDATTATTSANVTVSSTSAFKAGDFVYITDNPTGKMNVRKLIGISNSTNLITSSNVSFLSTNAAVGTIPGMESQTGAFKYANNSGIVRYITKNDSIFDTYKVFAVKVVLVSDSAHIVPKMADIRCLALQI